MHQSSSHEISPITNQTSHTTTPPGPQWLRLRHLIRDPESAFFASAESSNSCSPTTETNQIDSSKNSTSDLKKWTPSKIWRDLRRWVRYYFCFSSGVLFASGLAFSDMLIDFSILALLITYVEGDDSKSTAILVMIQDGLSLFLQSFMSYISIAIFSRFQVIFVSSFFYISGLLLFFLRSKVKANISTIDVIGILLLAVGQGGVRPLIVEFVFDQFRNHNQEDQEKYQRVKARQNAWYLVVLGFSSLTAFLTYSYGDQSGPTTLMASLAATGSSLILFLIGTRYYHTEDLGQRPNTCRSRFVTSFNHLQESAKKLFMCQTDPTSEEDKKKIWKRWWTIFLFFGLVLSGGRTFFPYQGENMDQSKYLSLLVIMRSISSDIISFLFDNFPARYAKTKKVTLVRIGVGMLTCIPCFLFARWIEFVRFGTERTSIFRLVPQFCMLGLIEGLAAEGLDKFMIDLFSDQRRESVRAINALVIGLGNFANILLFSLTGKSSDYGLPRYFLILTIISSVVLFIHLVVSILFYHEQSDAAENDESAVDKFNTEEEDLERVQNNLDHVKTGEENLRREKLIKYLESICQLLFSQDE